MTPPDLFKGEKKNQIIAALAAADGSVYAGDLCETVYGSREQAHRDSMRNLIAQMRPRLVEYGFEIQGRKELRSNAYRLINTLL